MALIRPHIIAGQPFRDTDSVYMLLVCSYLLTLIGCRISEDLLEDTLQEVGNELDHVCDDFAEALYNDEFAYVSSDT